MGETGRTGFYKSNVRTIPIPPNWRLVHLYIWKPLAVRGHLCRLKDHVSPILKYQGSDPTQPYPTFVVRQSATLLYGFALRGNNDVVRPFGRTARWRIASWDRAGIQQQLRAYGGTQRRDQSGEQSQSRSSGENHQGRLFPCLDPPSSRTSRLFLCLLPRKRPTECIDRSHRLNPATLRWMDCRSCLRLAATIELH